MPNSMPSAGWWRSRWVFMIAAKPSGDSSGMTIWWASRPWLVAFCEERRLPWAVTGPRERAPLACEARMRLSEDKIPLRLQDITGVKWGEEIRGRQSISQRRKDRKEQKA